MPGSLFFIKGFADDTVSGETESLRGDEIAVFSRAVICTFALSVVALGGCAQSSNNKDRETVSRGVDTAVSETNAGLEDAILSPATDLNLRRTEIPQRLKDLKSVYSPAEKLSCADIENEVVALTEILGVDYDDVPSEELSDSEKAGQGAANATLDVISGATSGAIPFRGLVRMATGASAHEKRIRASYLRGLQRRSYLKGLGQSLGCEPPASPLPPSEPEPVVIYK